MYVCPYCHNQNRQEYKEEIVDRAISIIKDYGGVTLPVTEVLSEMIEFLEDIKKDQESIWLFFAKSILYNK